MVLCNYVFILFMAELHWLQAIPKSIEQPSIFAWQTHVTDCSPQTSPSAGNDGGLLVIYGSSEASLGRYSQESSRPI